MTEQPRRPLFASRKRASDQPPLIRIDARTLAYFTVILFLVGLAGWLYLHQASQVATYAHEIRQLEHNKERLHREMIALRAKVATAGSLETILERAQEAGYSLPKVSENQRILILDVPMEVRDPAAELQAPLAPVMVPSPPSSWPERMLEQLIVWLNTPPG